MKREMVMFIPVSIEDADVNLVVDYAYYCDAKISIHEMPYDFEQWQQANYEMAD